MLRGMQSKEKHQEFSISRKYENVTLDLILLQVSKPIEDKKNIEYKQEIWYCLKFLYSSQLIYHCSKLNSQMWLKLYSVSIHPSSHPLPYLLCTLTGQLELI